MNLLKSLLTKIFSCLLCIVLCKPKTEIKPSYWSKLFRTVFLDIESYTYKVLCLCHDQSAGMHYTKLRLGKRRSEGFIRYHFMQPEQPPLCATFRHSLAYVFGSATISSLIQGNPDVHKEWLWSLLTLVSIIEEQEEWAKQSLDQTKIILSSLEVFMFSYSSLHSILSQYFSDRKLCLWKWYQ